MSQRFQSGGTLRAGSVYVTRSADDELPEALLAGELPYVLAPRQMGKSSLRVRTEARLRAAEIRCASVDLSALGSQDITADAWCFSIADELSSRVGGPDPESTWKRLRRRPPTARLVSFIRRELLEVSPHPLVIFFDEIDSVLSLPFSCDDFFAGIRALYNAKAEDPACAKLAFCFLGVATPADLMENASRTPFNVGRAIRLEDFSRAEARQLAAGLGDSVPNAEGVVDAVFDWTEGHPYMAQRVCEAVAREGIDPTVPIRVQVARIVGELFLQRGRVEDLNLGAVERLFSDRRSRKRLLPMLDLYARLLDNEHVVAVSDEPVQAALRLTGIAAERDDGATLWLRVRNPIVATVFDHGWVEQRRAWLAEAGPHSKKKASKPRTPAG
ncbi:MAG: AAA-like domain-containing protein [Polyangiaceae bacterium]